MQTSKQRGSTVLTTRLLRVRTIVFEVYCNIQSPVLYLEETRKVNQEFLNAVSVKKNLHETSTEACSVTSLIIQWGASAMIQHLVFGLH